jgi:hypothetical protein
MRKHDAALLLDQVLEPISASLDENGSRKLLKLKANPKVQARVRELAEKCNEGEITPEENREYEMYLMVNHIVAMFQAKAKLVLAKKARCIEHQ